MTDVADVADDGASHFANPLPFDRGMRIWLGGHNIGARRRAESWLLAANRPPQGPLDGAVLCPDTVGEAEHFAAKLRNRLSPNAPMFVVHMGLAAGGSARSVNSVALAETLNRLGYRETGTQDAGGGYVAAGFAFMPSGDDED